MLGLLDDLKEEILASWGISSPSDFMIAVGNNILLGMLVGFQEMTPAVMTWVNELTTAMLDGFGELGENAKQELQKQIDELTDRAAGLAEQIGDAIDDAIGSQIDLGRAEERALAAMQDFRAGIRDALDDETLNDFQRDNLQSLAQTVASQVADARATADQLAQTDPKKAAAFFQMRQRQIAELGKLQQEWLLTNDQDERDQLLERLHLLEQASAREQ